MATTTDMNNFKNKSWFSPEILNDVTLLLISARKKFQKYDGFVYIVTETSREENAILRSLDLAEQLIGELKGRIPHCDDVDEADVSEDAEDSRSFLETLELLQSRIRQIKTQFRQHRPTFVEQGWLSDHCNVHR